MVTKILCIVGSSCANPQDSKPIIIRYIQDLKPDKIISGECPFGGVDIHAKEIALHLGIEFQGYPPRLIKWEGGFKERNLEMARACTHCLSIRSKRSTTYGSGWTVDRAEEFGKVVFREMIK